MDESGLELRTLSGISWVESLGSVEGNTVNLDHENTDTPVQ
jgi:hypothetical protein